MVVGAGFTVKFAWTGHVVSMVTRAWVAVLTDERLEIGEVENRSELCGKRLVCLALCSA